MFGKILSLTVNICAYEFKVYSFLYVIKYIIVNDYLCHLCGVILTLKSNGCDILMIGHKVEKDLIAETEAEIGVVDPKVETKVPEKEGTIQELIQVCIVNIVR